MTKKTQDWEKLYKKLTARQYAQNIRIPITSLTDTSLTTVSRFNKYSKEEIQSYLKSPTQYEQQLRDVSIYMYTNSMQYYNLINYFALMPQWRYIVSPLKFDRTKVKEDTLYKQYIKVIQTIQNMHLPHEMDKVMRVCFREDVFYGVCLETKDSFQIQKINPDYCRLSSIEDGVFNYSVDFSQIRENMLPLYPDFFTPMWNAYQRDQNLRWQEIPADVGICIKVNEDLQYCFPPFAPSMPLLYDIEDYRDLILARTEIDIYKLLQMKVPMDEKNIPMEMDLAMEYYDQALRIIPETIGVIMNPMEISEVKLEKTGLTDTDEVTRAENHFWSASGTSPLLFGGNTESVTALKYSIMANEQLVLAVVRQVERWLNRRLKNISGTQKFRVNILPLTHFNQEDKMAQYQEAATLGLPTKSMYAASLGIELNDISALTVLENEVLEFPDTFIPLNSSYNQGAEETEEDAGRPSAEETGDDLTDAGEQTRNDEENEKRGTAGES